MPTADLNHLKIEYETFGEPAKPPVLLIMGLGAQLTLWPEAFCQQLAEHGFHVIRYDNRDVGLSTKLAHLPEPNPLRIGLASLRGQTPKAPYLLPDMADDAIGLLDALSIDSAHIVGASMGGMIAQIIADQHRQRVKSLTTIMSSSGNPELPGPTTRVSMRMVLRPKTTKRDALIAHSLKTWKMISSPRFRDDDETMRRQIARNFDRSYYPPGYRRQFAAVLGSGDRVELCRRIEVPSLIVHGKADPLVPVVAAYELDQLIPHADLEVIDGMGHDLPAALVSRIAERIADHLAAA